jgi:hypothetical protein
MASIKKIKINKTLLSKIKSLSKATSRPSIPPEHQNQILTLPVSRLKLTPKEGPKVSSLYKAS